MSRSGPRRSPLPQREGLDPARYRLPADGPWPTVREHLYAKLDRVDNARIDEMFLQGRYVDDGGVPLSFDAKYVPRQVIWFHRDLPAEVPVPFGVHVLYADERIVVADKPHFLATIPRGQHIMQTALVRLRRDLDLPELSPAHRLDRATAGVLLFTTERRWRGAYQNVFRDRRARKTYLAVAPHQPGLRLPDTVRSHIVKVRGELQARELEAPPNAETLVEILDHTDGLALYRLTPRTGRTHQLRLHLAGLGIPILGDALYPVLRDTSRDDFTDPLQLLSAELAFEDPVDRRPRRFTSRRRLAAWPGEWPDLHPGPAR